MEFTILEARSFNSGVPFEVRREVKDYEIDIECINGRIYSYDNICQRQLKRGDVLVRRPHGVVVSEGVQNSYIITLDFSEQMTLPNYTRNIPGPFQSECNIELIDNLDMIIHPEDTDRIMSIYKALIGLPNRNSQSAKALVCELIYLLNAELCRKKFKEMKTDNDVCSVALDYIQKNISKQISLDSISELVHLEKSYFVRLFRKNTGRTPIEMLVSLRLEKANDLVANTDIKICDIASMCGYNTISYFISEYKKLFGITPAMHRKQLRESGKDDEASFKE